MLFSYDYEEKYKEACLELFLDVFRNEPWHYTHFEKEKITCYFTDLENTPNFYGTIFIENEVVVGFCFGVISDYFGAVSFDIKEIIVRRGKQGEGVGTRMLKYMEENLGKLDVSIITLTTRQEIDAFKFYEKNAYNVSEGAVMMSKFIK